jgi:hypothetical protein
MMDGPKIRLQKSAAREMNDGVHAWPFDEGDDLENDDANKKLECRMSNV